MSSDEEITVVHCVRDIDERSGGPARSVPSLVTAQSRLRDIRVVLVAEKSERPLLPEADCGVRVHFQSGTLPKRPQWEDWLQGSSESTILHVHGLWSVNLQRAASWGAENSVPVVVSPRGMLEQAALRRKRLKKKLGWYLYQGNVLRQASLLHATSTSEIGSIRKQGLRSPVVLSPNGIDIDRYPPSTSTNGRRRVRKIVFLGRLDPIKNLSTLLEAWSSTNRDGWQLVLAGPDEGDHKSDLLRLVRKLKIQESVHFPGEIAEKDKRTLIGESDCLVLPSLSENFGMVVVEALASGVPVIACTGTPWSDLRTHACGWWVDPDAESLGTALRDAMSLSHDERVSMGQRGRELVRERYQWPVIAEQLTSAYRWVLRKGPKPAGIH